MTYCFMLFASYRWLSVLPDIVKIAITSRELLALRRLEGDVLIYSLCHISLPVAAGAISNCYNPLTSNDQTLQPFPHPPPPSRSLFFNSWRWHYCSMKKQGIFRSVPIVVKSDRVFFRPTVYTGTAPSARIYVKFCFGDSYKHLSRNHTLKPTFHTQEYVHNIRTKPPPTCFGVWFCKLVFAQCSVHAVLENICREILNFKVGQKCQTFYMKT
jgi:hypothetical protein